MSESGQTVVLGAGIAGVLTALELQRRGERVLLVDREGPAAGCSFGNGGAIGPNSCTPFALPGILRQIPKWYLDPDGPVTVNPRWALKSAPWILRWIRSSAAEAARRSSKGMRFLHAGCLDAYRGYLGEAGYADLIREQGYLYVYESATPGRGEQFAAQLRRELGIPSQSLTAEELREREPTLSRRYKRATLLTGNGHTINPKRLVDTLYARFREAGGAFLQAEATGFETSDGRVSALRTKAGPVALERFVLCAGAWSKPFARDLGASLPLVAERGYHVTFGESAIRLGHKVMNGSRGFGATSMETGLQITGTVELDDVDASPSWRRAEALAREAASMFEGELGANPTRWMGCRPSLPDSLPVIDRSRRYANAYLNFGHSHWGLSGSPGSARLVADMIAGAALPADAQRVALGRFG